MVLSPPEIAFTFLHFAHMHSPPASLPLVGGRLRGLNLFEYVTISEKLSEPLAAYYMEQLMSALEYLHNLNVVHLAIKPENVMVVKPATELPVVKLLHFSRAREVGGGASSVVQPHLDHMEFEGTIAIYSSVII